MLGRLLHKFGKLNAFGLANRTGGPTASEADVMTITWVGDFASSREASDSKEKKKRYPVRSLLDDVSVYRTSKKKKKTLPHAAYPREG